MNKFEIEMWEHESFNGLQIFRENEKGAIKL